MEFNVLSWVHPGIEFSQNGSETSITPQIKFMFRDIAGLNLGVEFPISKFDFVPDDVLNKNPRIMTSLDLNLSFGGPPSDATIIVKGIVYDSTSKEPVPATISFMRPTSGLIQAKKGIYRLYLKHTGAYTIRTDNPDYMWQEKIVRVMPYDTVETDFSLLKRIDWSIRGKIIDEETGKPIDATVKLTGRKAKKEVLSDPAAGEYKFWVPSGSYYLYVKALGYKSKKIAVHLSNLATLDQDIALQPRK